MELEPGPLLPLGGDRREKGGNRRTAKILTEQREETVKIKKKVLKSPTFGRV